ncbi:MAG: hypothetical protein EOM67_06075 [Spirochaetia bacterium]|nr:hypothetical protein [Spirochaetia bacterium]
MKKLALVILIITLLFVSCSDEFDGPVINFFSGKDRMSPRLITIQTIDESTVVFTFDEFIFRPFITLEKEYKESTCYVDQEKLVVSLSHPLSVMRQTNIYFSVRDNRGNSTTISAPVYGINTKIPNLVINEFSTRGSTNHPDRVELKALTDGNLGGVTLYHGMFFNHTFSFSFPSVEVKRGDYIVVQFQQIPPQHSPLTYYGGSEGLGGNNGVISLYNSPYNEVKDVVLYSNRTSDSDEAYGGFGTKDVYEQVIELTSTDQWVHNGVIRPESAINSDSSTATRSFNRKEEQEDTNSASDWYVVITSGSTFGEKNTTTQYSP